MDSTTLKLGDITFTDASVPQRINWGGKQMLSVHRLVGGTKIIDAMGADEAPISWSGWFTGSNATANAQAVDAMRAAGLPQTLTWAGFNYQVIIESFDPDFERFYQIPYRITCEVIANNTVPVTSSTTPSVDSAIATDNIQADSLTSLINDPTLTGLMATVDSAIGAVVSIELASQSTINAIQDAVQAAQDRVTALTYLTNTAIGNPTNFGGVTAGQYGATNAAALTAATESTFELYELLQLAAVLGRIMLNLDSVESSPNTVATAGGNLFQVAANEYGDATDWAAIAAANGLIDPFVQGVEILVIPTNPGSTGGILES